MLLIYPLFYSLQTWAAEDLYTSTDVNVRWGSQAPIPTDDRGRLQQRGTELAQFFRTRVLSTIPSRIWNDQSPPNLTVSFESDLPTDGGLFVPPETEVVKFDYSAKKSKTRSPANHVDRVTIKINSALIRTTEAERTLAHEFFHAVHWIVHKDEPAWLREGLAQVFETRVYVQGKFNTTNLSAGFSEFSTPLTGEMNVSAISPAHYGHLLLYFWYLYQRCGGDTLFWNIAVSTDGLFGEKSIEWALKREGSTKIGCRNFSESVAEAELARAINTRSVQGDDRDRWFLLSSTLAKAKARDALPSAADWKSLEAWTPLLVSVPDTLLQWKVPSDGRAWWIKDGPIPQVSETAKRPSPQFTKLLILKRTSR